MTRREQPPAGYRPLDFPLYAVTVDIAVFTILGPDLAVLLIERGTDPYQGAWALPGGFVQPDEDLETAAARELSEETGVRAAKHLEQFGAYGAPNRDPRMRIVSVAYLAILPRIGRYAAASDARQAALVPVERVLGRRRTHELAFDHERILTDALERVRANSKPLPSLPRSSTASSPSVSCAPCTRPCWVHNSTRPTFAAKSSPPPSSSPRPAARLNPDPRAANPPTSTERRHPPDASPHSTAPPHETEAASSFPSWTGRPARTYQLIVVARPLRGRRHVFKACAREKTRDHLH